VGVSVDDFGTGYSSMSYLQRLPVSELKVDRSFITGLSSARTDHMLVRSTVDLGHNLGLRVVAEGVEDPAALAELHQLGCDIAQGFYFAHPMPPEEFISWLAEQRAAQAQRTTAVR
jgi:EAL domain-containing protein (putative c-di-GMP-specific phosphodiesterase class I)